MFYERFISLCEERLLKPNTVTKHIGLSNATATRWKKNPNTLPEGETLVKLADFFNCSIDYLAGRTNDKTLH